MYRNRITPQLPSLFSDTSILKDRKGHLLKRGPPNGGPVQTTRAFSWDVRYRRYLSFIIPVQVAELYIDCLPRIALRKSQNAPAPGNACTLSLGSVFLAF